MKQIKQYIHKPSFLSAVVMIALMAVVGCGELNHSPLGSGALSDSQSVTETPAGYLVFSPMMARQVAAKTVKVAAGQAFSHSVTKGFEFDENEKLEVAFDNDKGSDDDDDDDNDDDDDKKSSAIGVKKATFSVRKNSIDISELTQDQIAEYVHRNEVDITMAVSSGTTLEDVAVGFGPSGLLFHPSAKLEIQLTGNLKGLIAEGQSFAYHIGADGTITTVEMEAEVKSNGAKLRIEVPGFSRYTIDD